MRHIALLTLVCCSCASPHRSSSATHERRTYQGRSDGLVSLDVWTDTEKGGGVFFLTTADVQSLGAIHTNQTALGGGSAFFTGPSSVKVDPQTGTIIEATGSAVGDIVGAALKKAAGIP